MNQNTQKAPRILITTSRNPSRRTRTLIKDLSVVFPNASRVPRGTKNIYELAVAALEVSATLLLIISTRKGNPWKISFYRVTEETYFQLPLELSLIGVKLRYEITQQKISKIEELVIYPIAPLSQKAQQLCETLSNIFMTSLIEDPQSMEKTSMVVFGRS